MTDGGAKYADDTQHLIPLSRSFAVRRGCTINRNHWSTSIHCMVNSAKSDDAIDYWVLKNKVIIYVGSIGSRKSEIENRALGARAVELWGTCPWAGNPRAEEEEFHYTPPCGENEKITSSEAHHTMYWPLMPGRAIAFACTAMRLNKTLLFTHNAFSIHLHCSSLSETPVFALANLYRCFFFQSRKMV